MDCRGPAPVQRICLSEATIFQPAPAQEVERAISQSGVNKRRSCIYQMAILALAGAQILLLPLPLSAVDHSTAVLNEIATRPDTPIPNPLHLPAATTLSPPPAL